MKKLFKVLGTVAILAALVFSFASCDDLMGSTSGGKTPDQPSGTDTYEPVVYTSFDPEGTLYELKITRTSKSVLEFTPANGDSYTLTVTTTAGVTKTSTGQITVTETTYTLKHTGSGETFSVTVSADSSSGTIVSITGDIPINNSSEKVSAPIMLAPALPTNKTPVASDYDIGNLTQTEGSVTAVTITPKAGKSSGKVTIYYTETYKSTTGPAIINTYHKTSTTVPTTAGSYSVTFDVAATPGWNPATGLSAGTLTINAASSTNQTPVASDYDIGNLTQTAGSVTAVAITPKAGKSSGAITIKYAGSTTIPQIAGTYAVTFDVAAASGWNAATGLSAGTLTIALSGGGSNTVFTSIFDFEAWLRAQPENTASTAYSVALNISSLGGSYGTSGSVGKALANNSKKYVGIDFSGSTFTSIEFLAFSSNNLTSVTIGNSVISIGSSAFSNCKSLASVTIPDSVTSIGDSAFWDCTSLTAINVASGNNAYTADNGVLYNKNKTALVYYPARKTDSAFTIPNKRKMTHFTQLQS